MSNKNYILLYIIYMTFNFYMESYNLYTKIHQISHISCPLHNKFYKF